MTLQERIAEKADFVVTHLYPSLDTGYVMEVLEVGRRTAEAQPENLVVLAMNAAIERELQRRSAGANA